MTRGCAWCTAEATGQTSSDIWACDHHLAYSRELDDRVRQSGARLAAINAEVEAAEADAVRAVHAQQDALRSIAAAAVKARREVRSRGQLPVEAGTALLMEVERQLSALIAVGAVPPPSTGHRPLTS